MKDLLLERIRRIMSYKSINSVNAFANIIGVNTRTISQQISGNRSLSLDTILAVLGTFEDISAEWLIRGNGSMFLADNVNNFDMRGMITGDNNMAVGDNSQVNNADNDTIKMLVEQNQKLMNFIMEGKK